MIDLGDLKVFQEARPSGTAVGSWVRGTIGLGLDPFSYFERLHAVAGIPPLVYTWSVDHIQPNGAVRPGPTIVPDLGWVNGPFGAVVVRWSSCSTATARWTLRVLIGVAASMLPSGFAMPFPKRRDSRSLLARSWSSE